jgi:hypothetical protein
VLIGKYGLKDGDNIELDGRIIRAEDVAREILKEAEIGIHGAEQTKPN